MNIETRLPAGLWNAIRSNYEKNNYTASVLDGFYYLSEILRNKSGLEGDGVQLVGQALGGASPKIKINKLQTESENNVQRGTEQLLRGLYQAIRNPRSHEKHTDTEEDAQILLAFLGYIIRKIDKAKAQFSVDEFNRRVVDPDFVSKKRYAELLVSEVPTKQYLEVFMSVYRVREQGKPENLKLIFGLLFEKMQNDELNQVYQIISDDLKSLDDEDLIRVTIGAFEGSIWPHIHEVARLRIENKLIKSIKQGRFDRTKRHCKGGAFGTWATRLFPYFSLSEELGAVIKSKLNFGDREEEGYIFEFFLQHLIENNKIIMSEIEEIFIKKLKKGNQRFYDELLFDYPWPEDSWSNELKRSFNEFKAVEDFEDFEDDIPF